MLILASTSPWRLGMFTAAGIPAEGVAPRLREYDIDFAHPTTQTAALSPDPSTPPEGQKWVALATARAQEKARSVAAVRPTDWVIGADQVCWLGERLFEKPTSPAEHLEHLQSLRGKRHCLSTVICLKMPDRERIIVEHSWILMRADLKDTELAAYVGSGEGSGCAGGYQAEARGALLIERIEGDWNNVIGLPLFRLISVLREEGWKSPLHTLDKTIAPFAAPA